MKKFSCFLILFFAVQFCFAFEPSEVFDKDLFLAKSDNSYDRPFRLFWKLANDEIIFEAHVATLGWAAIGFNNNEDMTGADIIVFGVANNRPYIFDMHGVGFVIPELDRLQSYASNYGAENATHTIVKFRRKIFNCDKDDWDFSKEPVEMLWAFNPNDARNERDFDIHSVKGHKKVAFMEIRELAEASDAQNQRLSPSEIGNTKGRQIFNTCLNKYQIVREGNNYYNGANGLYMKKYQLHFAVFGWIVYNLYCFVSM